MCYDYVCCIYLNLIFGFPALIWEKKYVRHRGNVVGSRVSSATTLTALSSSPLDGLGYHCAQTACWLWFRYPALLLSLVEITLVTGLRWPIYHTMWPTVCWDTVPAADSLSLKLACDKKQARRVNDRSWLLFLSFEEYSNFGKEIWGFCNPFNKIYVVSI